MTESTLSIDDFRNHKILWGDLFWLKKDGKQIKIGSTGELIDIEYLEKAFSRGHQLIVETHANHDLIDEVGLLLSKLESCEYEHERVSIQSELTTAFLDIFVARNKVGNIVDWNIIAAKAFFDLPEDLLAIYDERNTEALYRAQIVASLTVFISIVYGYLNFGFLKQIYNSVLVMDLEMVEKGLSEYHLKEFDKQRLSNESQFSGTLLDFHKDHTSEVVDRVKVITKENKSLEQMLKYHHEVFEKGTGPCGIFSSDTGDLQKILNFVDRIVPYEHFVLKEGDGTGFISSHFNKVVGHERLKRILETESGGIAV